MPSITTGDQQASPVVAPIGAAPPVSRPETAPSRASRPPRALRQRRGLVASLKAHALEESDEPLALAALTIEESLAARDQDHARRALSFAEAVEVLAKGLRGELSAFCDAWPEGPRATALRARSLAHLAELLALTTRGMVATAEADEPPAAPTLAQGPNAAGGAR